MALKKQLINYTFRLLVFFLCFGMGVLKIKAQNYTHEFEVGTSNDVFVWHTNTDRYYSYGVHLNYRKRSDSTNILRRYFKHSNASHQGIGVHMKAYTPGYLEGQEDLVERPYAGWTYLEYQSSFSYIHSAWKVGLEIGVLGPHSYVGNFQNWFHREVSRDLTIDGWDDQIGDMLGVNLRLEYVRQLLHRKQWDLNVMIDNSIGNIFLYTEPAVLLRIGQFNAIGESVAKQNNLLKHTASKEFFLEASARLKLSLFNATIQRNIFKNESLLKQDQINNAIFNAHVGLVYSKPKWVLKAIYFYSDGEITSNDNHFYMTFSGALRW